MSGPGWSGKDLKMVEIQSIHRQELEKIAIPGQAGESGSGQVFAFTLAMAFCPLPLF
jgi:hypothetical protein